MWNEPALLLPELPDLLRRFTSTPYEECLNSGDLSLHIKTNEPRLVDILRGLDGLWWHGEATWTMLFDPELPATLGEAMAMESGAITFISFGRACMIAIDGEKKDITGFVSTAISEREWSARILPELQKLMAEMQ
jgi:hypothetical protein